MSIPENEIATKPLKLPVVLTPRTWQEAVHLDDPQHLTEIVNRLGDVVLTAYRELSFQPNQPQIEFGLYRFPPRGDRSERVWLELKLHQVESETGTAYLCISLRDEDPVPRC